MPMTSRWEKRFEAGSAEALGTGAGFGTCAGLGAPPPRTRARAAVLTLVQISSLRAAIDSLSRRVGLAT